ncbi:glycosyltransferase family 4 protein [Candidatus Woesearchaeota archaeon]|nr:glycosyltransferase family 4 protein [Candidatus Woesearchaeota archaeon]
MKVLIVTRRYIPEVIGGGQLSVHYIARILKKKGIDVRVLTFTAGIRKDEIIDKVPVTRLSIRTIPLFPRLSNLEWMYYEMYRQTMNYLKEFTPDILHSFNSESAPSLRWVSKKTAIPYVVTINGPNLFCFTQKGIDSKGENCLGCGGFHRLRETIVVWGGKSWLRKSVALAYWLYSIPHMKLFEKTLKDASLLLPISYGIRDDIVKLGYSPENMQVVHNPQRVCKKVRSNINVKLGIPKNAPILLYAGRIEKEKGIQNIITLLQFIPDAHAIIIGRGAYEKEAKNLAKELNAESRTHFVPWTENSKLGAYYSKASIVLMPGRFYESLGRMLLEACAHGVSVIGTRIGGIPDVIEDGNNGFLLETFSLGELLKKVKKILASSTIRKNMGAYGKRKIKKEFSEEKCFKDIINAYNKVLSKKVTEKN